MTEINAGKAKSILGGMEMPKTNDKKKKKKKTADEEDEPADKPASILGGY